jgi:lipopolysaccharide/colanic/teichoic acid biosynthesis glycosyltransferase
MHALGHSTTSHEALPGWKRTLDILCCIAALPFMAVAACWAGLITVVASPGPILFRQERVGYRGRRFYLYKFRTMHVSANVASHQAHLKQLMKANAPLRKLDEQGDRRLIPGGWLLRATGLDELPQIINVLRGEMSIVGPRPCIPYEYENFSADQRRRLESVPGLTGLWQVSGKNRTTFEEMIRLDVAYGENRTLTRDVGIILRTVPALAVQVMDTRRARRAARPATIPVAAETADVVSSTYLAKSQNVIAGDADIEPSFVGRAAAETVGTSTPFGSRSGSMPRRNDRTGPQV